MSNVKTEATTIELPKGTKDLANGLGDFVAAVKKALDDGFQIGQDVPMIISAAIGSLIPAIQAGSELKDALKEMPVEAGYCYGKLGEKIVKAL